MSSSYKSQKVTNVRERRTGFNKTADYQMNSNHETKKLIDEKKRQIK